MVSHSTFIFPKQGRKIHFTILSPDLRLKHNPFLTIILGNTEKKVIQHEKVAQAKTLNSFIFKSPLYIC